VLLEESLDGLHVEAVVLVGVPFEGRRLQVLVSEASVSDELLDLHVVVRESGQLSSLPGEVADVEGVMEGSKEEQAVHNHGPLVHVPELHRVHSIDHFDLLFIINLIIKPCHLSTHRRQVLINSKASFSYLMSTTTTFSVLIFHSSLQSQHAILVFALKVLNS